MDPVDQFRAKGWKVRTSDGTVFVTVPDRPLADFSLQPLSDGRRFLCRMENEKAFADLSNSYSLDRINCPPRAFRAEAPFFETMLPAWIDRLPLPDDTETELKALKTYLESQTETERKAESTQRKGQDILRKLLLAKVGGRCMVSGIGETDLLVASHIKGWAECVDDAGKERLDPENVLLLAKNYDALFDRHYISFDPDTGTLIKSNRISPQTMKSFGLPSDPTTCRIEKPSVRRAYYLRWHIKKMKEADAQQPQIAR